MALEDYQKILASFGQSLGLEDASPDEEGYCAFSFDDLVVHMQYTPDDDQLTIYSRIGEVDEDRVEGIYGMLLAANMFWQGTQGATFSVEPDLQLVFLADKRTVGSLGDTGFTQWLDHFLKIAEYWQNRLTTANEGGSLLDDGDVPPTGPSSPMTRV
ncbi:hypothetical protein GC197_08840 [bacterium]|nr:hypothetical protein [bacterium]